MKKIFKFFATLASLAAVAGGAFLVYKKFFAQDNDDFDFDDSFADAEDETSPREYVSINITTDETEDEDVEPVAEEANEDATVSDETTEA